MMTAIAHVGITVSNLEQSVLFYRCILGLQYLGEMKMGGEETARLFGRSRCEARVAYLQAGTAPQVELIRFTSTDPEKGRPDLFRTSISELCFATDDIDRDYQRLKDMGVRFLSEPQTFDSTAYGFGKSRAVYFYDPDDNILELIQTL